MAWKNRIVSDDTDLKHAHSPLQHSFQGTHHQCRHDLVTSKRAEEQCQPGTELCQQQRHKAVDSSFSIEAVTMNMPRMPAESLLNLESGHTVDAKTCQSHSMSSWHTSRGHDLTPVCTRSIPQYYKLLDTLLRFQCVPCRSPYAYHCSQASTTDSTDR